MSYLLDKKARNRKLAAGFGAVIVLFFLIEWHSAIFSGLSSAASAVLRPVLSVGSGISENLSGLGAYFSSKSSLSAENEKLQSQIQADSAKMANYNALLSENARMKEILYRTSQNKNRKLVMASVLAGPDRSLYNTLIIDAGEKLGISTGNTVFAYGVVPIGTVAEADAATSKVTLFSAPGEKTFGFVRVGPLPAPAEPAEGLSGGSASDTSSGMGIAASGTDSGIPSGSGDSISTNSVPFSAGQPASHNSVISNTGKSLEVEIIGRGGGNFEMDIPRGISIEIGADVTLPGITSYVLAKVSAIISDPRDALQKFLLTSPINVRELQFVEIEKK